jgi:hypothetical protein
VRRVEVGHPGDDRAGAAVGDAVAHHEHRDVPAAGAHEQVDAAAPVPRRVDRQQRAPDVARFGRESPFRELDTLMGREAAVDLHPVAGIGGHEPGDDVLAVGGGVVDPLLRRGVRRRQRDLAHQRVVLQVHTAAAAADRSRVEYHLALHGDHSRFPPPSRHARHPGDQ